MAKIPELANIKYNNGKVFRFPDVIESIDGHKVFKFNNDALLNLLKQAADNTISKINNPVKPYAGRINEFGNYVQHIFTTECQQLGLKYSTPIDCNGNAKECGYPDGFVDYNGYPCYVEVKTYSEKSKNSTLRSFFYSPSENSKITMDAAHILVGFLTQSVNAEGPHTLLSYHFTDMYEKNVQLKLEFNQNNKELYKPSDLL